MKTEIELAVKFILSHLYNNLPRLRVESFGREIEMRLYEKLNGHWFPNEPCRDVQYRCVRVTGPHMDNLFNAAAQNSGLQLEEIKTFLPNEELCMWLDPGEVTYRIGSKSPTQVLLDRDMLTLPLCMAPTSLPISPPLSGTETSSNASSSASVSPMLLLAPSSSTACNSIINTTTSPNPSTTPNSLCLTLQLLQKSSSTPSFTAATFAQTKFGSTKLKSPMKTKISPMYATAGPPSSKLPPSTATAITTRPLSIPQQLSPSTAAATVAAAAAATIWPNNNNGEYYMTSLNSSHQTHFVNTTTIHNQFHPQSIVSSSRFHPCPGPIYNPSGLSPLQPLYGINTVGGHANPWVGGRDDQWNCMM